MQCRRCLVWLEFVLISNIFRFGYAENTCWSSIKIASVQRMLIVPIILPKNERNGSKDLKITDIISSLRVFSRPVVQCLSRSLRLRIPKSSQNHINMWIWTESQNITYEHNAECPITPFPPPPTNYTIAVEQPKFLKRALAHFG